MVTESLAPPGHDTGHKPCRCGCAPCEETCCRLECLVQPRFFCGQLLTDQDLKALVDWTSSKFRLTRYRHGWGVVCGLEVRCDPKRPSSVIVAPGYAIDCCGNDIIVCEDYCFDLGKWCPSQRCDDSDRDRRNGYRRREGYRRDQQDGGEGGEYPTFTNPFADAAVLDLSICYEEQGIDPKVALGRCGCGESAPCEPSRTREGYRICVTDPTETASAEQTTEQRYRTELKALLEFVATVRAHGDRDPDALKARILTWIARHPLHQFCFVSHMLEEVTAQELAQERVLASILFWIIQDYRNAWLTCACYECEKDKGVPIARVWLDAGDRSMGQPCHVISVDWRPPYRRPLGRVDCWPTRRGCVSLANWIWRDPAEAAEALTAAGVTLRDREVVSERSWQSLERLLECDLLWACDDEPVIMQVVRPGEPFGDRVAGFCRANGGGRYRQTEQEGAADTEPGEGQERGRSRRHQRGPRT